MSTENTKAELQDIAEVAAAKAVKQTLLTLGIDASDPIQAQQDFVVLREMRALMRDQEFQADMAHIRRWRKSMEAVQSKGLLTVVGILVTGVLGLIVMGIKGWVKLP